MADDQFRWQRARRRDGVIGRSGQGQQHALFAETIVNRHRASRRHDHSRRRATKQATNRPKATRAGNEYPLADTVVSVSAGIEHAAD
jgi:hypothetical protein